MARSLILLDTDKVKDYVFTTGNLKEIRGASSLLEELNTTRTKDLLQQVAGAEIEVVYCGGGSVMAIVPSDRAGPIIQAVQKLYCRETVTASISGAVLPLPDDYNQRFGKMAYLVGQKLRQVKDEAPPSLRLPLDPWFRHCASCGYDPAEKYQAEEAVFLCRSCWNKRRHSDRQEFWYKFKSGREGEWVNSASPQNLGELGQTSTPPDYIGFIYADGNSMGQIFRGLDTVADYTEFSDAVRRLIREVTHEALAEYAKPRRVNGKPVAPFEILLMGGDDLMLVTAADLALPVAVNIAQEFERRSKEETNHKLSLAVGVVLAHASYPIAAMVDLGAELLVSAKQKSTQQSALKQQESTLVGAIDFMVVTAASSRELSWVRKEALTSQSFLYPSSGYPCRLTQRPYSLDKFAKLYRAVLEFKKEHFPSSQLQALYDSLFVSFNTASFVTITALARLRQKHRAVLSHFIHNFDLTQPPPWSQAAAPQEIGTYSTALGDLVEIYRFVSEQRRQHGHRHD